MCCMIQIEDLEAIAVIALDRAKDGGSLDPLSSALIALGCRVSVCSLDRGAIADGVDAAFEAGASTQQIQEVIALVSGLGVHSLMVSAVPLFERGRDRGELVDALDPARQKLWDQHVGDDPYWGPFEKEVPGFLRALLILSPDLFEQFFAYCAVPWRSGTVSAVTKELIALATDATPSHRFVPGFRLHLRNAIMLGATKAMVRETLRIAAATPEHRGTSQTP
jgi:alkylhydroperoxidase/carboxymuconolactone decarboxylase family protein YurZ